jgi:hypothetical protein
MAKKTELTTVTMSGERFDGTISVSEISGTDGTWQCTYEKKIDETTSMIAHEGLVIASNVVDATNIYRSRLPEWVRGSFPTKEESLDCKHCNAPVGECDGNCDALPNELDDTSENMG